MPAREEMLGKIRELNIDAIFTIAMVENITQDTTPPIKPISWKAIALM
jgi:hypothetical protein